MRRKKKRYSPPKEFKGRQRDVQKGDGFFDGRFTPKIQKLMTKYTRKKKHKND